MIMLELAAIILTATPESSFTIDELLDKVRALADDDMEVDENDVRIVLGNAGFLKKLPGKRLQMK